MARIDDLKQQYNDVANLINQANNALGLILTDIVAEVKEIEHGKLAVRHTPADVPEQPMPGPEKGQVPAH